MSTGVSLNRRLHHAFLCRNHFTCWLIKSTSLAKQEITDWKYRLPLTSYGISLNIMYLARTAWNEENHCMEKIILPAVSCPMVEQCLRKFHICYCRSKLTWHSLAEDTLLDHNLQVLVTLPLSCTTCAHSPLYIIEAFCLALLFKLGTPLNWMANIATFVSFSSHFVTKATPFHSINGKYNIKQLERYGTGYFMLIHMCSCK